MYPKWSPFGAARFLELIEDGFFTDVALYRSVDNFLTQFGISDRSSKVHWHSNSIRDDVNIHIPITKYMISFAGGGANTRSTQVFIASADLDFLGTSPWETPFGVVVVEGRDAVDAFYTGYGDMSPNFARYRIGAAAFVCRGK